MPTGGNFPQLQPHGWLLDYTPKADGTYDVRDIPYAEFISRDGNTQEAQQGYGAGDNQATFPIDVYFSDWESGAVTRALLGVNRFNRVTGQLDRMAPAEHPYMRQYSAARLSAKPYCFAGKFAGPDLTGGTRGIPYAGYRFCRVDVSFGRIPAVIQGDTLFDSLNPKVNVGGVLYRKEWLRFVVDSWQTATENLVREASAWKWGEGPRTGERLKAPHGEPLSKPTRDLTWLRVPRYGLFSAGGGGPPANLLACVGGVNDAPFLGHPAGTLRLETPRFTPLTVPAYRGADVFSFDDPAMCFDVTLPLTVFDPPAGGATRGHNLAPDPTDGLWYKLVDSQNGTQTIHKVVDFTSMFVMSV
jgi:hypothetical protein